MKERPGYQPFESGCAYAKCSRRHAERFAQRYICNRRRREPESAQPATLGPITPIDGSPASERETPFHIDQLGSARDRHHRKTDRSR